MMVIKHSIIPIPPSPPPPPSDMVLTIARTMCCRLLSTHCLVEIECLSLQVKDGVVLLNNSSEITLIQNGALN